MSEQLLLNADLLQILTSSKLFSISDAPKDLENGSSGAKHAPSSKAEAGIAEYLIQLEERRSIKVKCRSSSSNPHQTQT